MCCTSPPYWGLRDYGVAGQIGLEDTPAEYVAHLVEVFREVRRVLRDDGVVWLNLGDSYCTRANGSIGATRLEGGTAPHAEHRRANALRASFRRDRAPEAGGRPHRAVPGLKPKDLVGIPWTVAFALRDDGWWLRSEVIWAKPNPMPESVRDRPTKAHEQVFLLTKSERYYYDAEGIAEPALQPLGEPAWTGSQAKAITTGNHSGVLGSNRGRDTRNARSVWTIATTPYPEAHFATFPPELPERCIKAGSSERACETCGAPWQRTVDERDDEREPKSYAPADQKHGHLATGNTQPKVVREAGGSSLPCKVRRTTGWEPTCACQFAVGAGSCVVLDPFAGAGTTGMVALRLNRSFVGIELNPQYVALARRRISEDAPLFNRERAS